MNRKTKQGVVAALVVTAVGVAGAGCLSRQVEHADPILKTNFSTLVPDRVIDKVDLLFDIDNSASMGDKQAYLKAAIPDLVNRLINPNCVDPRTHASSGPSMNGTCSSPAERPEFPPVHDLHLGVISSSLGPRGSNTACDPHAMALPPFDGVLAHNDDQAHLLSRKLTYAPAVNPTSVVEGAVGDAPSPTDQYLYWFPTATGANAGKTAGPGTAVTNPAALITDFTDVVGGAGVFGCGVESQLESWYRFLVQPDPYESIVVNDGKASWQGVDTQLLAQRKDFLRPDSLVAIVVLSDENDSEIDVRSLGGQGVAWMSTGSPLPKGTSGCGNGLPGSNVTPSCQSCAQGSNAATDPSCAPGPGGGKYAAYGPQDDHHWGYDLNLRHVHMRAKYGVDPQFPIDRYRVGLTSKRVPDRDGEYPPGAASYVGTPGCQNPLFAASLPDGSRVDSESLCHAPPGTRSPSLVFYAHIGGVPSRLLHFKPGDPVASTLTSDDWVKILGKDPVGLDYTGIDPHMIESYQPRPDLAPPGSPNDADPDNGHEWITDTGTGHILRVDRQYACIFPLSDAKGRPAPRDCTLPQNANFCDCPLTAGSVTTAELPPICDTATPTLQTGAKAYPTIRELLLAKEMGPQGIVSSICPIHAADSATGDDPLYGYRPAVAVIVDRLKAALTDQCLPEKVEVDPETGSVPCLILLQIPDHGGGTGGTCASPVCPGPQFQVPEPQVLSKFCDNLESQYMDQVDANGGSTAGLTDPASVPVCQLRQLTATADAADFSGGSCEGSKEPGWCYVTGEGTGADAGGCPQAVVFTSGSIPTGAVANLQCLEQSVGVLDGGAGR